MARAETMLNLCDHIKKTATTDTHSERKKHSVMDHKLSVATNQIDSQLIVVQPNFNNFHVATV